MVGAGFATYAKCLFSQSPFLPTSSRCLLLPLFLFMSVFSPLFSVSGNFPGEVKRKNGDGAFFRQEGKGEKVLPLVPRLFLRNLAP